MNLTDDEKEEYAAANYGLIYYFANKYKSKWNFDDLVGAGGLGMTRALNYFDKDKGIKFATYASRCIINDIFMFMRKEKKHLGLTSIEEPLTQDHDGNELKLLDILSTEEKELTSLDWEEINTAARFVLENEKPIRRMMFELFVEGKTQPAIAEEVGMSQSYVSRAVRKTMEKIKKEYWSGSRMRNNAAILNLEKQVKEKDAELAEAKRIIAGLRETIREHIAESWERELELRKELLKQAQ